MLSTAVLYGCSETVKDVQALVTVFVTGTCAFVVLVGIAGLIMSHIGARERRDAENKARFAAEQAQIARETQEALAAERVLEEIVRQADAGTDQLERLLARAVIIGAEVWMQEEYEPLFGALEMVARQKGCTLLMHREVYHIITRSCSHEGMSRIERLTAAGILKIPHLANPPDLLSLTQSEDLHTIVAKAAQGGHVNLISDHQELRIRALQAMGRTESDSSHVSTGQELNNLSLLLLARAHLVKTQVPTMELLRFTYDLAEASGTATKTCIEELFERNGFRLPPVQH